MRGAPFGWSNLGRGLNTLDSPYQLQQGEARDCLNVVSTVRGAIRKRFGSIVFGGGANATFPALAVTDALKTAENPLSNGGKWSTLAFEGAVNTGMVRAEGEPEFTGWLPKNASGGLAGARWNVAEQTNPAVSLEIGRLGGGASNKFGTEVRVWCCVPEAGINKGYSLRAKDAKSSEADGALVSIALLRDTTVIATGANRVVKAGTSFGVAVRGGVVTGWIKEGGLWEKVAEAVDATYTKGYGAITDEDRLNFPVLYNNFSIGEIAGASTNIEFQTLAPVRMGTTGYLIASAGKNLYSIDSSGTITIIKEGLTENARWSIVQSTSTTEAGKPNKQIGGPIWLVNGKDKPLYWTGVTKATEAKTWVGEKGATYYENATSKEFVPNGKYMVLAGNRIWMAGMSDDLSAVRFSDFSALTEGGKQTDPTAWLKENVIRFDSSDNEPITGLGKFGPYVLVFKRYKTWVIHDLNEGGNRKLSDSVGCVSHRSIVETPQGTFFLTPDHGVYMTRGSNVQEMSERVRPTLQNANPEKLENAAAGYLNGHYYISFASHNSSTVDKTLDYDIKLGSWWMHDLTANQWVVWEAVQGTSVPSLYIARANGKNILKAFVEGVYQDAGVNYVGAKSLTAYWISHWEPYFQYILRHRINAPNQKKRVRQLFFDGSGQIIPLVFRSFKTVTEEDPATVNEKDMAEPEKPVFLTIAERETSACRLYSLGVGRVWSFGFGNKSAEPFEIDGIQALIQFRKS